MIKTMKMWACYNPKFQCFANWTIAARRKDSIAAMSENMTWKECREYGWQCIKVNVIIEPR